MIECMKPEAQLILLALQPGCVESKRHTLDRLVQEKLDWEHVATMAKHHRVVPNMYRLLAALDSTFVPQAALSSIEQEYQNTAIFNMHATHKLIELVDLFQENQIPYICFKGPVFGTQYFEDLNLRSFNDLDILVRECDLERVHALITQRGYQAIEDATTPTEKRYHQEYVLPSEYEDIDVEIHWSILPKHSSFGLTPDFFWEHSTETQLGGKSIRTVAPEEMITYLCIHGGLKHQWWRIRYLHDIAQVIHSVPRLNWELIERYARKLKVETTIYTGMYLAHRLLYANVPHSIVDKASRSSAVLDQSALVVGRCFFQNSFGLPSYGKWRHIVKELDSRTRISHLSFLQDWFRRIRYLCAIAKPNFKDRKEAVGTIAAYMNKPWVLFQRGLRRNLMK